MNAGRAVRRPAPDGAGRQTLPAPSLRGAGLVTGWGDRAEDLPLARPGPAAGVVVPVPTPALVGERFRRATRECLLAVAAVRAAVRDAGLAAEDLAGARTGILYLSATGYAAANRAFLADETATTLHFPYTSPSAVPGEVTIEFGVRGPYVNLMGGGTATLQGLWYAARWLAVGAADRVLVLAVEAIQEVRDSFERARRLYQAPLVEGAACLLLERGAAGHLRWAAGLVGTKSARGVVERVLGDALDGETPRSVASGATGVRVTRVEAEWLARRTARGPAVGIPRTAEGLAWGPLGALAWARAARAPTPWLLTATWRNDYGALLWAGRADGRAGDPG